MEIRAGTAAVKAGTLDRDSELDLIRRAQDGDRGAAERIATAFQPLVASIASRYSSAELPVGDLVQEGNVGLVLALRKFDPGKRCRFSTFARPAITWKILDCLRQHRSGDASLNAPIREDESGEWQDWLVSDEPTQEQVLTENEEGDNRHQALIAALELAR